jgi:hypothetical protein
MKDALIIVDHGSKRENANAVLANLANIFPRDQFVAIEPAHMELAEPTIAHAFSRCVSAGAERVIVSQFFLSPGRHATRDIPRMVQEAAGDVPYLISGPLGVDEQIVQLMLKRIDEAKAYAAIDSENAEDPSGEALIYGQRMSAKLAEFAPSTSLALRIAVRSQHIRRWEIPRDSYPATRQGYHQWRRALYEFHADTARALLHKLGYNDDLCARVGDLLRKQNLKQDPDAQILEDVACLVFLQHYFADFAIRHERDKLVRIVRKTWGKMSAPGQDAALELDLPADLSEIVVAALS